jgi:predicted PurR-regulated permease PerM
LETSNNIFKRQWRLLTFVLGVIVTFLLIYVFRTVLLPFVVGLVLAYLLFPVISWIERKLPAQGRWLSARRASLITLIFIVILALVGVLTFFIIIGVVNSFSILVKNAPQYFSEGLRTLQEWLQGFQQWFPPETQKQVGNIVGEVGTALGNAMKSAFIKGVSYVPNTFSLILGFVSLPIFLFYILKDWEKLTNGFYSAFSPQMVVHARGMASIINKVLGRWIRAQLVLSTAVAVVVFIGLAALGITLAPALAFLQGVMEFIPILGPWIGGAVGVIVVLAIAPEKAIWVAVVYLVAQLSENLFLVPRIQGSYLRIHPAFILILLPLGSYIAGVWGIILVVPLTATIIEIYSYFRQNMVAQEIEKVSE